MMSLLSVAPMAGNAADPTKPEPVLPTMKDVRYGLCERNVLDFYKAQRKNPTPVLIHIHDGGCPGRCPRG